ncbi:hypothetical protein JWS13_15195 [Rhodococcus pseudokoreensis]|uniref:Uncharacterized protein n=1 Tax=Rhodococcus pseudokoreensis TaxID=2811421 RepID=A0A974ZTN1_9NOCA|nr:hypothetical protein [Rhodococcus pseudokoreensis]QSE89874.1 hypothetical protein JWS13_15195 [Rhodococcus pseudokoreensis]
MTGKGQMALAVGAGYMLGRTHKMKLALMLAGAGASSRFPSGSLGVLGQAGKLLADSPEVAKLGATVRKELMNAAKTAAVTAASHRIDSLNSRLQSGGDDASGGKGSKRGRREEPEDDYDDEYEENETAEDDEAEDEAPRARKRPAPRRRTSSSGSSRPRSRSRSSTNNDDDEDETATGARKARAKTTTDVIPIRRTRK